MSLDAGVKEQVSAGKKEATSVERLCAAAPAKHMNYEGEGELGNHRPFTPLTLPCSIAGMVLGRMWRLPGAWIWSDAMRDEGPRGRCCFLRRRCFLRAVFFFGGRRGTRRVG